MIKFSDAAFHNLLIEDWYEISSLRQRVFVVEQDCPYLDADGKDRNAHHVVGRDRQGRILAYARIVRPQDQYVPIIKLKHLNETQLLFLSSKLNLEGKMFHMPAIGRVVLDPSMRGKGLGERLMNYAVSCCTEKFPDTPVFISAQKPLYDFYEHHGFVQSGPGYLEDGIPHIPMIRIGQSFL